MKNGVFFRLGLSLPKKAVAGWKKAKLRDQRERVPEELEALFGFGEELIYARYPEDLD